MTWRNLGATVECGPWRVRRGRLITLLEMIRFDGKAFARLGGLLGLFGSIEPAFKAVQEALGVADPLERKAPEGIRDAVQGVLDRAKEAINAAELPLSSKEVQNLEAALKDPNATMANLIHLARSLRHRIEDELSLGILWQVRPDQAYLFAPNLFGSEVTEHFPSAILDIEEAGKCLGMGRGTACAFHLMRVMEVGLRVLAATLKDPRLDPKRNPSWDNILKKCREELDKPLKDRAPEWAADDAFFSGAAATLMAVKDAWRNPTMHVEINYDEERALDVWSCVKAFMRHMTTRLRE